MKQKFRFFSATSADQEIIEIEGDDEWEIQDKLDAAWEDKDRDSRWNGVEDYEGPLE